MTERVIRIAIDSTAAEAGARRVVRSLDAITRKSAEAAEAIGRVEGSLRRLEQVSRSANSWLGNLERRIERLHQAMASLADDTRDLDKRVGLGAGSAGGQTGSEIEDLKRLFSELTEKSLAVETVLELANASEKLGAALPVIGRLLTVARSFTAAGLIGTLALEIIELARSIKQLDGVDRDYLALLEQVNDLTKTRAEVTREAVEAVRGAVRRKMTDELDHLTKQRHLLAEDLEQRNTYERSFPDPAFPEMQKRGIFGPRIASAKANIAEIEGKLEKLTGILGLLDQLLETIENRNEGVTQSSDALGAALESQTAHVEALSRETETAADASRRHGKAVAEAGDRLLEAMPDLQAAQQQVLRSGRELGEGARRAFEAYADAATDAGAQIERAIGGALSGLENALVGFVQTGKLEWKSLVDSMIADLIRLFIRSQILGPLAQGLGSLIGGGGLVGSYPGATFTAQGAAFESGRRLAFARGGVVGQPTLFPLAWGVGLMGEAGPEAVLPLKRLPGGDLGVRAAGGGAVFNQTIVNEAGVEIETDERPNATGGIDQLLVLVRKDAERQMIEGRLGRLTAQRFGLSDRPVGR